MQNDKSRQKPQSSELLQKPSGDPKNLARKAEIIVWVAVLILVIAPTVRWTALGFVESRIFRLIGVSYTRPLIPPHEALIGWTASMAPILALAFGVAQIAFFLRLVQRGESLSASAARFVARLGWALVVSSVLFPIARYTAIGVIGRQTYFGALESILAPGAVIVSLAALGIGFISLARVIKRAVAIAQENARFV